MIPLVIAKQGELVDDIQTVFDQEGMAMSRFDGNDGAIYIIRPDQHVLARWRQFSLEKIADALEKTGVKLDLRSAWNTDANPVKPDNHTMS